jgi:hypothetical protein
MTNEERVYAVLGLTIGSLGAYFAYQQINPTTKIEPEQTTIAKTMQYGYWGLPNDWFGRDCIKGPIEFKIKAKNLSWRRRAVVNRPASVWQTELIIDYGNDYIEVMASSIAFLGPGNAEKPDEQPAPLSSEIYRMTSPTILRWTTDDNSNDYQYVKC